MPITLKEAKRIVELMSKEIEFHSTLNLYSDEREALQFFLSLADKYNELETVLEAWQNIFGTTQLTHAQARLEVAEKNAERYKKLAEKIEVEKIAKIQLPYPATFTKASPDGTVNEITLSYEAAQAIVNYLEGEK